MKEADSDKEHEIEVTVCPDVSHVIKNLRNGWLTHKHFLLSQEGMKILGLDEHDSNVVNLEHVRKLISFERDDELKAAYKLSAYHLNPGQFGKMKVDPALTLLSKNTANALRLMRKTYPKHFPKEVETTARFLEKCEDWHSSVDNKHYGPYMFSSSTPDVNDTIKKHIEDFVTIATTLTVPPKKPKKPKNIQNSSKSPKRKSKKKGKKQNTHDLSSESVEAVPSGSQIPQRQKKPVAKLPWQIHIRNASNTILHIVKDCMDNHGFTMFLTSNLTSDCIESYHAVVRTYCNSPTPLIFKRALKLICLSQVFHTINKGTNVIGDPHEQLCLNTLANTLVKFKDRHEKLRQENSSLPENIQQAEVFKIIDSVWAKEEVARRRQNNNEQVEDFVIFDPIDSIIHENVSNASDDEDSDAGEDIIPLSDIDLIEEDEEDPGGIIFDFESEIDNTGLNHTNINGELHSLLKEGFHCLHVHIASSFPEDDFENSLMAKTLLDDIVPIDLDRLEYGKKEQQVGVFAFAAIAYAVCRENVDAKNTASTSTIEENTCSVESCIHGTPDQCTAKSLKRVRGRKKKFRKCKKCAPVLFLSHIPASTRDEDDRYSFIALKELVRNELCWPTQTCISLFWFIFSYFHYHRRWLLIHSTNVNANFQTLKSRIMGFVNEHFQEVPECHKVKLISRFINFLARRYAKDLTRFHRNVHRDELRKAGVQSKTEFRRIHVT